jgi:hypothetical protein
MAIRWLTPCAALSLTIALSAPLDGARGAMSDSRRAQSKPAGQAVAPTPDKAASASIAQLWVEPEPDRDLFYGVGGARLAPDPKETYKVLEVKIRGFSEGYTVEDSAEREWSAKLPPEAFTEIAMSRVLWGIGYHQPPAYLLREWNAKGARSPNPQLPARFREKNPDFHGLEAGGSWSFKSNPFVGTRELAGLLVFQAIIENPDIKASNNTIYTLKTPAEGATTWYVVRDLGYSLGRSSFNAPRANIDEFEKAPFIRGVSNGKVQFHYGGQYRSTLKNITVDDVHWICTRLSRLTDRQWRDAFRAAAYETSVAERYIQKLKARVAEGLALPKNNN